MLGDGITGQIAIQLANLAPPQGPIQDVRVGLSPLVLDIDNTGGDPARHEWVFIGGQQIKLGEVVDPRNRVTACVVPQSN